MCRVGQCGQTFDMKLAAGKKSFSGGCGDTANLIHREKMNLFACTFFRRVNPKIAAFEKVEFVTACTASRGHVFVGDIHQQNRESYAWKLQIRRRICNILL